MDVVWRETEDAPGTRSWNKVTDASQLSTKLSHLTRGGGGRGVRGGARGLTGRGSGLHAGTQGIKRESPGPVVLNPAFA